MCSNLPPPPAPPISNRDLPTANGPWVCLPLKLQHGRKWLICPRRAVSDSIRLGFFEDAGLIRARRAAIDRAAAKRGGQTWCLSVRWRAPVRASGDS